MSAKVLKGVGSTLSLLEVMMLVGDRAWMLTATRLITRWSVDFQKMLSMEILDV